MISKKEKQGNSVSKISDDELLEALKKEMGSGDDEKVEKFISTGSSLLDYAIANRKDGGVPVGRITEISRKRIIWKEPYCLSHNF